MTTNRRFTNRSFLRICTLTAMITGIMLMTGCNNNKEELARLQAQNDSLRIEVETTDENIETYFTDLNAIEDNLRVIKQKENLITRDGADDTELAMSQQDRINQDIVMIGELMEKNRLLIASLNNRIRNANTRIAGFEQSIERLNQTIEEKEIEIQLLRDQLAQMNFQVDFLNARVDTLERTAQERARRIDEQTLEINTAYYAIGSRDELIENQIITRQGGFLGMGRTEKLNANFNTDYFIRIDKTRDQEVTIMGKDPKIITSHPSESFTLTIQEEESLLQITNPSDFWKTSKYLVIEIK